MSARYEKARAIAEAAANRWDRFSDTAGIIWLSDEIDNILRQRDEWRALYEQTDPNQPTELCDCNVGDCIRFCRKCRNCVSSTQVPPAKDLAGQITYAEQRCDYWLNEAQRLAWLVRKLGGDPSVDAISADATYIRREIHDQFTARGDSSKQGSRSLDGLKASAGSEQPQERDGGRTDDALRKPVGGCEGFRPQHGKGGVCGDQRDRAFDLDYISLNLMIEATKQIDIPRSEAMAQRRAQLQVSFHEAMCAVLEGRDPRRAADDMAGRGEPIAWLYEVQSAISGHWRAVIQFEKPKIDYWIRNTRALYEAAPRPAGDLAGPPDSTS